MATGRAQAGRGAQIDIAIPYLPHISNFDEFDPLLAEPGVRVRFVRRGDEVGRPDAIILPGSKAVVADLMWLRAQGLAEAIQRAHTKGAAVVGVCGGYQMLGLELLDPDGLEGPQAGAHPGLGLLPTRTRFGGNKHTYRSVMRLLDGTMVTGYEIHTGETELLDGARPLGTIVRRSARAENAPDGAQSSDTSVWGTYLHGIFENDNFRRNWLASLGWLPGSQLSARALRESAYDRLADIVEASVDMNAILKLMGL
jgi:adenosylcobyric acid synthase